MSKPPFRFLSSTNVKKAALSFCAHMARQTYSVTDPAQDQYIMSLSDLSQLKYWQRVTNLRLYGSHVAKQQN